MPEKRTVVNSYEAAALRRRLVDPRRIKQIVLVATDDQPAVGGYATERVLPISAWAATNKTCHSLIGDFSKVDVATHIGGGTGVEGLVKLSTNFAHALLSDLTNEARVHVQFKEINKYPADRIGPRHFSLLTVSASEPNQTNNLLIVGGDEIVPEFDLDGRRLIEIQVDPVGVEPANDELRAHLARNQAMWELWTSMGVTEQTCLCVDFHFSSKDNEATRKLTDLLQSKGFKVSTTPRRTLFFSKSWDTEASQSAWWTLDRLQWRTVELFEHAATLNISLEGAGAMMGLRH